MQHPWGRKEVGYDLETEQQEVEEAEKGGGGKEKNKVKGEEGRKENNIGLSTGKSRSSGRSKEISIWWAVIL